MDGTEIVSVVEIDAAVGELIELVVEQRRDGAAQGISLTGDVALSLIDAAPLESVGFAPDATDFAIDAAMVDSVLFRLAADDAEDEERYRIRLWNTWMFENAAQAWTGNAGIVVEETEVPDGAERRLRLWCSDGLGNASFDDLVVTLTVGADSDPA